MLEIFGQTLYHFIRGFETSKTVLEARRRRAGQSSYLRLVRLFSKVLPNLLVLAINRLFQSYHSRSRLHPHPIIRGNRYLKIPSLRRDSNVNVGVMVLSLVLNGCHVLLHPLFHPPLHLHPPLALSPLSRIRQNLLS